MNIALSHISAQEAYYLDIAGLNSRLEGPGGAPKILLPADFNPTISHEEAAQLEGLGLTLPIHTLASATHRWHRLNWARHHSSRTGTPSCLVTPATIELLVSAPEHLFLQMAGELSTLQLIAFGFELCGRYSRDPFGSRKTKYNRHQLTTTSELSRYLSLAKGLRNVDQARTALKYVRDNSRSPMETYVAMRLGLPQMRGGFGLGMPAMNARIELDDTAAAISGKSYLECDLYFPAAKLDIEYESTAFHGNVSAEKNRADSRRRAALEYLGIKVLTLTDVQALNDEQLAPFAAHVAKILKKRVRVTCENYPARQYELKKALLGGTRGYGPRRKSLP